MGADTDRSEGSYSGRRSINSLNSSREFMTPDRR
jgi:hypothetical protein